MRAALRALFDLGAVPVLNENDATATDEISFGDNDLLAAQVAVLLGAQRLLLLTAAPGRDDRRARLAGRPRGRERRRGEAGAARPPLDDRARRHGEQDRRGRAGRGRRRARRGSPRRADLPELLAGRDAGTFFAAADRGEPAFKLWLRHGKRMVGTVRIDDGAARAITAGNASLLAVGVTAVVGAFRVGTASRSSIPPTA